jgi:tRNA-specific 2-thiouridylase
LPTAARKDSQGICFLGKVKFSEFISQHLGDRPGNLIEIESGTIVGRHRGFWFHTIGQRQGLGLPGGPWYVAAKDASRNVVYISRRYHDADKRRNAFRVGGFNWLGDARPGQGATAGVRVKVRGKNARNEECSDRGLTHRVVFFFFCAVLFFFCRCGMVRGCTRARWRGRRPRRRRKRRQTRQQQR